MNSNVFFQPFVGKDYANGGIFDKRIMILGESHYCDESCTLSLQKNATQSHKC